MDRATGRGVKKKNFRCWGVKKKKNATVCKDRKRGGGSGGNHGGPPKGGRFCLGKKGEDAPHLTKNESDAGIRKIILGGCSSRCADKRTKNPLKKSGKNV